MTKMCIYVEEGQKMEDESISCYLLNHPQMSAHPSRRKHHTTTSRLRCESILRSRLPHLQISESGQQHAAIGLGQLQLPASCAVAQVNPVGQLSLKSLSQFPACRSLSKHVCRSWLVSFDERHSNPPDGRKVLASGPQGIGSC